VGTLARHLAEDSAAPHGRRRALADARAVASGAGSGVARAFEQPDRASEALTLRLEDVELQLSGAAYAPLLAAAPADEAVPLSLSLHGELLDQPRKESAAEARGGWSADSPIRFEPNAAPARTFAARPAQLRRRPLLLALRSGRCKRDGEVKKHSSGALLGQGAVPLDGLLPGAPLPFRVTLLRYGLPVGSVSGSVWLGDADGAPLGASF